MSTIALHHILLQSPLLADDIMKELTAGAEFGDLASEFSACPSAKQQGFAGYHDADQLPENIVQALYEHDSNSPYAGPVRTTFGYHILKVADKPQRSLLVDA